MNLSVNLVPLNCLNCRTPIPAETEEVGWVCVQCGAGAILTEADLLVPLHIRYGKGIAEGRSGRPFWVTKVEVDIALRKIAKGTEEPSGPEPWNKPRTFCVPAFSCGLDELLRITTDFLFKPPVFSEGPKVSFDSIVLRREEIAAYIEFTIISVEAQREDKLTKLDFNMRLGEPELWVLP